MTAADRSALRILVVEDSAVNRALTLAILQRLGYVAHAVPNGLDALEEVSRSAFDGVLLDCHLPDLDGLQIARAIRDQERPGQHLPIIGISARSSDEVRHACIAAGMDDYVEKPVSIASLAAVLRRWVPLARPQDC
jgi:CheY-like chemotaxis protein